jgi:eukaryotic-like serine/threonine-protein kinase
VVCQTLQALAYIHKHGIVHRDVKPSNILVGMEDGRRRTRLADFGLAKSFDGSGLVDLTNSREVRGTLAYIAPDQVEDCRHAGPPADIYSTGATLYQFLTGRQPLEIDSFNGALIKIRE